MKRDPENVIGLTRPLSIPRRWGATLASLGIRLHVPGSHRLYFWAVLPSGTEFEIATIEIPDDSPIAKYLK